MLNERMNTVKVKLIIISCSMILISIVYIFSNMNKNQQLMANNSEKQNNMFYIELVNYTLPVIKVLSTDDNMDKDAFSIKNKILSCMGINLVEPDKIIKKEMAYFSQNTFPLAYDNKTNSGLSNMDSFNLSDSDVTKNEINNSNLPNSVFQVYDPKLKKTLNVSKPDILIYHSHTTESYYPYGSDNMDPTKNVCAVGDVISKELENNYGIAAIHDITIHNAAAYTKSYERSGETVDKYLSKYGDFKMIIDIHRDSALDKKSATMMINGENTAKFMFVMARKNPHYDKNIALVNSIMNVANKDFPGMCNGIYYYDYGTNFFNQAKSDNAFLLEIGSDVNTMDEAKATGKYIARILAQQLNK